ncbi:MAG TPA: hypothetical protein VNQ76_05440, partial [Planctomicrobium sp.]|nr:hypothetical protein [Planctomicrobium sp.]
MAVELEKEKSIFFHALSIESAGERAAYVMDACEGNELLLNGVSALLKENDRLDSPLDKPLADLFLSSATRKGIPGKRCDQYAPGAMIGPYKLMEQIGEGGFGLVFVADQQQPVRRRVALKIIKPEIGFSQIIARFEAERQALAM